MKEQTTNATNANQGTKPEADDIPCFLCGVCCSKYHVQVTFLEARRIADNLGISWDEWLEKYAEPAWPGTQTFLLRRIDGVCIFLRTTSDDRSLCRIHAFKPSSCLEWTASLFRRECKEGLAKCWGLTVDASGHLEGPETKLRQFKTFLDTLQ